MSVRIHYYICYHILAAKMSRGLEPVEKNRVINLRALCHHTLSKKCKKKIDNKSCRKHPRFNDNEIEFKPAPDSAFSLNTPLKIEVKIKTPSTVESSKSLKTQKSKLVLPRKSNRQINLSLIKEETACNNVELQNMFQETKMPLNKIKTCP